MSIRPVRLLAQLIERGAVAEANGKGKAKLYQLAEQIYITLLPNAQKEEEHRNRVRAVVNFMTSFYCSEELVGIVKCIAEEACQLAPEDQSDHYMTYEGVISKKSDKTVIFQIIGSTPRSFFEGPTAPISLKKLFENFEGKNLSNRISNDLLKKYELIINNLNELAKERKYFHIFIVLTIRKIPKDLLH